MKQKINNIIVLLVAPIILLSCMNHSFDFDSFVLRKDVVEGIYSFDLDMSDTLGVYDIMLFGSLDWTDKEVDKKNEIKLNISLISPTEKAYNESVYLPKNKLQRDNFFSKSIYVSYRKDIKPPELGRWKLTIRIENKEDFKDIRGLGCHLLKKSNR